MVKGQFKIYADTAVNRLYLCLEGYLTDEQVKQAADLTISETQKLRPGFSVINDITLFKPASKEGAEHIKRAQAVIAKSGVSRVIRVIDDKSTLAKIQFARKGTEAGYEQNAGVAGSVKEAEEILKKDGK